MKKITFQLFILLFIFSFFTVHSQTDIVNSLGATNITSADSNATNIWTQEITIGGSDVTLSEIKLNLHVNAGNATCRVTIRDAASVGSGTEIEDLGTAVVSSTSVDNTVTFTSATNPTLSASTPYYINLIYISGTSPQIRWNGSTTHTNTGTLGTIGNPGIYRNGVLTAGLTFDLAVTGSLASSTPEVTLSATPSAIAENGGTTTLTATTDIAVSADEDITITYSGTATNGVDYTGSTTITIPSGLTMGSITLTGLDDTRDDDGETITATITATETVDIGTDDDETITITDDDPAPEISIGDVTKNEGDSGFTVFNFTVSMNRESNNIVTVNYSTANGTATAGPDYIGESGTVIFFPGDVSETVMISVNGDGVVESNETFTITLSSPSNGTIDNGTALGTITNDDSPPAVSSITLAGPPSANDGTVIFEVDFSETVSNVSTDDFSLTKGGTADGSIASVSASSGSSINVTVNNITGTGTLRLDLNGSTNISDSDGNSGPAAFSSGSTHTVDRDAPTFDSTGSTPNDDATGVSVSDDIVIDFNENIGSGSGNITLKIVGGSTVQTFSVGSSTSTTTPASGGIGRVDDKIYLNPTDDLTAGTSYAIQIDATAIFDSSGNSFAGISDDTTFNFTTVDTTPPSISSISLAADNSYVDVTFTEGVFNMGSGSGALEPSDFDLSITGGSASSPNALTALTTGFTALAGGETTIRIDLSFSGNASGAETLEVDLASNSVFDAAGNAANANQTSNNTVTLNDQVEANITSVTMAPDNSYVDVTFSEGVFSTLAASGGLEASDFSLGFTGTGGSLTNLTATSTTTTVGGALSGGETTIRLNFSVTGTPDGSETLEVDLAGTFSVFDAAGNASTDDQSNNTAAFNDQLGPVFSTSASQNVAENTTAVVTLAATDLNPVTYSIIGGDDQGLFSLSGADLSFSSAPDFEMPGDLNTDNDYVVQVQATDGANPTNLTITVSVTDVNDNSPVFSTSSTQSVAENTTAVVTLASSDGDAGASVSYSIIGGDDQGLFSLVGADLSFSSAPDFETPDDLNTDNDYVVQVQATDGLNTANLTITVSVTDVNDNSPVFSTSSTQSIAENNSAVVTLASSDGDAGASVSYSIIGGDDQGLFSLTGADLSFSSDPDFEMPGDLNTDNDYIVQVQATDGLNTADLTITVSVTDINDNSPVFSTNFLQNVPENTTAVVTLVANDADAGSSISYSVIGGDDQGLFSVVGADLSFSSAPDFEMPGDLNTDNDYIVQVEATDGLNTANMIITVTVTNVIEAPLVLSMTPMDDAVDVAVDANLSLTFDQPVLVGTGNILIRDSADDSIIETIDVTGSAVSIASDVVTINPTSDLPSETNIYVEVPAGAFVNPGAQSNLAITGNAAWNFTTEDNTAPTVVVSTPTASPTNMTFTTTFTFSEPITNFDLTDITITNGSASIFNQLSPTVYNALITPTTDGEVTVSILAGALQDVSSNANDNEASNVISLIYDVTNPTLDMTTTVSDPTNLSTIPVTFTFSEPMDSFDPLDDLDLTNATVSNFVSQSASVFTADITPIAEGLVTIDLQVDTIEDLAGNANEAATFSIDYDITPPTVVVSSPVADPTNAAFDVTITFSEDVVGLALNVIQFSNGIPSNFVATANEATITITPVADGPVTVFVPPSAVQDLAGNGNVASNVFEVVFDGTRPTVDITTDASDPTNAVFTATFTFSEDVTGFEMADIIFDNATPSGFNPVSATVYTVTVTPDDDGTVTIDVPENVAEDAATNGNEASDQFSVEYDFTRPTVDVTSSAADPINASFNVTITFDEDVTGFEMADLAISNATPSNFSGSGTTYTVTITPTVDGSVTVEVPENVAEDAATNGNEASDVFDITFDATRPIPVITSTAADPTNVPFDVTITFSEDVFNFIMADLDVENGTASNFAGSGSVYTVTITPTADGAVNVSVPEAVAEDSATNPNEASNTFSVGYDATNPMVTITTDAPQDPTNLASFTTTFTFSEDVIGFDTSDITVTNGVLSDFDATNAPVYTATITPSADGLITIDVAAAAAQDAATNTNPAAQFTIESDQTIPTGTITSSVPDPANAAFQVTITFSEPVNGFTIDDINVGNGTASDLSGTGTVFTATITPTANGGVNVFIPAASVEDAATNPNDFIGEFFVDFDGTNPMVTITTDAPQDPTNLASFTTTFTFSEDVIGFDTSDITVTNGVLSDFDATNAPVYTATITPSADGLITIDVAAAAAQDAATNTNPAAQFTILSDQTVPTVTVQSSVPDPANAAFQVTITFSEPVNGFTIDDIDVGNGTASNFAGNGTVFTSTITPTADGGVTVLVPAAVAEDDATNPNDISNVFSVEFDGTNPTADMSTIAVEPVNAPFTVDIVFDENVFGFEMADLVVTNGTPSDFNVVTATTEFSVLITPTGQGNVVVEIPAGVTEDLATNPNNAESFTIIYDNIPPNPPNITHISDYTCSGDVMQTGDNTLEISGTAERESIVEVFIDGVSIGTVVTDSDSGFFTFDYTETTLADGTYTFIAQATDAAVNTGALSQPFMITINTVDSDGDGNPDFCDDDDNGNGSVDAEEDCDGDGIVDSQDTDNSSCRQSIIQTRTYGFSPNGDGVNDGWVIENITAFPNNVVQVFNRSGKLVFKQNGYQNDWEAISNQLNGNTLGRRLPVGPYIYVIDLGDGSAPQRGWLYINY